LDFPFVTFAALFWTFFEKFLSKDAARSATQRGKKRREKKKLSGREKKKSIT
jgi:hypothetical protein